MPPLIIRKPKVVLFDVICTVVKADFLDRLIFPYIRSHVDDYLADHWGNRVLMHDVELLRLQSLKDAGPAVMKPDPGNNNNLNLQNKIRNSVADYVVRCLDDLRENEALRIFR